MRKPASIFVIPALILLSCNTLLYAQVEIKADTIKTTKTRTIRIVTTRTAPVFILEVSGGWNFGAMELSGHNGGFSMGDFILGKSFCARNGFGANLSGKLRLNKEARFWIVAAASFNRFQSNLVAGNDKEGKVAYNLFSGGLGLDYNFTPAHRVKYFIGASSLFSIINGKATILTDELLNTKTDIRIKPSFRIGYTVYLGLDYAMENNFGLNCGIRFTHANLLLKDAKEIVNNEIPLNDKSLPTGVYTFSGWRQFAYITAYAGVSFYFKVKERKYKLP